jgi:murein DD-endopeptidase MepM/ murein hydrolase activator NlpD
MNVFYLPKLPLAQVKSFLTIETTAKLTLHTALFLSVVAVSQFFIAEYELRHLPLGGLPVADAAAKYGLPSHVFDVKETKTQKGDVLFSMLTKNGLSITQADSLLSAIKPSYDFDKMQIGKTWVTFTRPYAGVADYLAFEPSPKRYILFDLTTPSVKEVKRAVSVQEFETAGRLKQNLWKTLVNNGMSYSLTTMVEKALKSKYDLNKLEEGDEYKLIWEEEVICGRSVGVKSLKGVYLKSQCADEPIYAVYFNNGREKGWYEKDVLPPAEEGFLSAPLKRSRITSYFSLNRLHPILGYHRPHYGTDYAAPHGTPIFSVADGIVEEAQYKSGNGNYVKIKHKDPYQSQYLHMSRFAKGIKAGTQVEKGQVIGYVGSTGLATGPHVCFRFWKNGQHVNHLAEKLPLDAGFTPDEQKKFKSLRASLVAQLNKIMPRMTPKTDDEAALVLKILRGQNRFEKAVK